jgi:hypothetical protein
MCYLPEVETERQKKNQSQIVAERGSMPVLNAQDLEF